MKAGGITLLVRFLVNGHFDQAFTIGVGTGGIEKKTDVNFGLLHAIEFRDVTTNETISYEVNTKKSQTKENIIPLYIGC